MSLPVKRFRVFAGPNGSGKSTIIKKVAARKEKGYKIDFGIYVNADDIASALSNGTFSFANYGLGMTDIAVLRKYAIESGLIRTTFTLGVFDTAFTIKDDGIILNDMQYKEGVAQLLSNFLISTLIALGKKCSIETVFSHSSKIDFMRYAASEGYRVYLYFVATEDPEINVARVKARVLKGGHNVTEQTIRDRYYRTLDLLYDGAQEAYQCFFFDNSTPDNDRQIAHFKIADNEKIWDSIDTDALPNWFIKYYYNKQL